jgi:hypothetical protein
MSVPPLEYIFNLLYIIRRGWGTNVSSMIGMQKFTLWRLLFGWCRATTGRLLFQCTRTSYNNWLIWLCIYRRGRSLNGLDARILTMLNIQWTSTATWDCGCIFNECRDVVAYLKIVDWAEKELRKWHFWIRRVRSEIKYLPCHRVWQKK